MNARTATHWTDVAVTAALLCGGIYGLVVALGFPERAQVWPVSVMTLLIVATAVHLVLVLRRRSDAAEPRAEGSE